MDIVETKELMESWAREKIVCEQALARMAILETKIKEGVGGRERSLYSENVVVHTKPGRKSWKWEEAVYAAHLPTEKLMAHSVMKTNFRKVCEAEGITKDEVGFTQGDPIVVIELAMSDTERAEAMPVNNLPSSKMFK